MSKRKNDIHQSAKQSAYLYPTQTKVKDIVMEMILDSMLYSDQETEMNVQYLVDQRGHKTGVFLSIDEFEHLMELLEEAQDIKDYRAAKTDNDEWVSLLEAKKQLGL